MSSELLDLPIIDFEDAVARVQNFCSTLSRKLTYELQAGNTTFLSELLLAYWGNGVLYFLAFCPTKYLHAEDAVIHLECLFRGFDDENFEVS